MAGDVINLILNRQCVIKDDTQALDLNGGGNWRAANGEEETVDYGESRLGANEGTSILCLRF